MGVLPLLRCECLKTRRAAGEDLKNFTASSAGASSLGDFSSSSSADRSFLRPSECERTRSGSQPLEPFPVNMDDLGKFGSP